MESFLYSLHMSSLSALALHAARCDAYSYLRDFEAIQRQSHSTIRTYPTMKQAITLLHLLVAYPAFLAHRISSVQPPGASDG